MASDPVARRATDGTKLPERRLRAAPTAPSRGKRTGVAYREQGHGSRTEGVPSVSRIAILKTSHERYRVAIVNTEPVAYAPTARRLVG